MEQSNAYLKAIHFLIVDRFWNVQWGSRIGFGSKTLKPVNLVPMFMLPRKEIRLMTRKVIFLLCLHLIIEKSLLKCKVTSKFLEKVWDRI